jgi:hypothetical protein
MIGGPVSTGCGWTRCLGVFVPACWIVGGDPAPNKLGGKTRITTAVTKVKNAMAATMTMLGNANPAGCRRAAATAERDDAVIRSTAEPEGPRILRTCEDCADISMSSLSKRGFLD